MKTNFFSSANYRKKSFYPTFYLHRGYSMPSLVRFEKLFHPMKNTYFFKFVTRVKRKFPYEKQFFCSQAIAKNLFVLHSSYTGDTPLQLHLILKFVSRQVCKFLLENFIFSLGQLQQQFLLCYIQPPQGMLHTKFGSNWTTL